MLSASAAFDIVVTAVVGAYLDIESAAAGSLSSSYAIAGDFKSVVWYIPRFSLQDGDFTSSFVARVQQSVFPNTQNIVCTVSVIGKSRPGTVYGFAGRNISTSVNVSLPLLIAVPTFAVANTISSIATTLGTNLEINEDTTVQMNITMVEGTAAILANLYLPTIYAMAAFDTNIVYGSRVSCSAPAQQYVDNSGDGFFDTIAFTFGICEDSWDNVANVSDIIIITVIITPLDVPANLQGRTPTVNMNMMFGNGGLMPLVTLADSIAYTILEPNLASSPITVSDLLPSEAGDLV